MTTTNGKKLDIAGSELKLCNCDGFWHVECPDGITRYVDLTDYDTEKKQQVLKAIGKDSESLEMNPDAVGGYNYAKQELRLAVEEIYKGTE